MYSDEKNLAFLLFLHPVLDEVQRINKIFESRTADKSKLFNKLTLLIKSIGNKLKLPSSAVDVLTCDIEEHLDPKPYLGYKIENKFEELKSKGLITIEEEEMNNRHHSQQFFLHLFKQMKKGCQKISIL